MSRQILTRDQGQLDRQITGRSLSGIAVPWDTPTRVRDKTGPAYIEAFSPTSADVSIQQRTKPFPMFVGHDYLSLPITSVQFISSPSERAYLFETEPVVGDDAGDVLLERVNNGSMTSVSIGFLPINSKRSVIDGNEVDEYRTEISLRELSLAPTGFGQYADAAVTAVRADGDADADDDPLELIAAVDAIIDAAVKCLDPTDDDFNPAQAADLLTGAESTVDALMDMFGIPDPDDMESAARASVRVAELVTRLEVARASQAPEPSVATAELQQRARSIHLPQF